jgi:4-diphosphocytidyl-2-C-methyl-D-erythritol kinase
VTARVARATAHAKINLILRVLSREESGFHTLETLFARVALGDTVTVRIMDSSRSVECDTEVPGPPEHNLAYRAAVAFAESTGWPSGFAIELEKRIPLGGGLGGGSADAGAVLRALAALSPTQVREERLLSIAAALGSAVPSLTTAAPLALAWGRGERMLALPAHPERDVALVLPDLSVSTAAAYSWLAASRAAARAVSSDAAPSPQLISPADLATWRSIASLATNDFEPVVAAHHPEIGTILSSLYSAGATLALMSGSGSTVFGVFDSPPEDLPLPPGARTLHTRTVRTVAPVEVLE